VFLVTDQIKTPQLNSLNIATNLKVTVIALDFIENLLNDYYQ